MTQSVLHTALEKFVALDEKISHLESISGLLSWDQKVIAPKKGRAQFSKAYGALQTEIFDLMVSKEMGELLAELSKSHEKFDHVTKAKIRLRKHFYDRSKSIPSDLYKEYSVLCSDANDAWEEARGKNDYYLFLPFLQRIVEIKKKFVEYYGYEKHPYDALLDEFEPGLTVEMLDPLFASLREKSIALLNKIKAASHQTPVEIVKQPFAIEKQKEFNRYMLPQLGFDLDAGRLDETVHPFAQTVNTGDVRITTRYLENNVLSALFGTIHEAGHGIYEQQVSSEYEGTVLCGGTSFGIHESQSRFLENMVGRSEAFWTFFLPKLKEFFPSQLQNVDLTEFYEAVNTVNPSFIRVEADELTYNLHIMLRYEIEKELFEGKLEVSELPAVWNKKMEEFLGIIPPSDTLGVLQDVHWSFGGFGYFPSYSLGNLYAAQILKTMKKELPDFDEHLEAGNLQPIMSWLKEKIHQHGSLYKPNELIVEVTGEELNAAYLVEYLEEKYSQVYQL
jgi:carboxypeptidase Taq